MSKTSGSMKGHMGPMGGPGAHGSFEKPKDMKGTFGRLLKFMKPYRKGLICVILLVLLSTVFNTLAPRVLGLATNQIDIGFRSENGVDFGAVMQILILLGCIYLLAATFNYLQQFIMSGVSQKTMYDIRTAVDQKIRRLPLNYFDTNTFGDVLSRVTNDVDTVSTSLQQSITQLVSSVITIVMILIMMFSISPLLSIIGLITLPFSLLVSIGVVKKSQGFFRGQQQSLGDLNGFVEEMYTGHNVIKAYGKEEDTIGRFEEINDRLYRNGWKAQFVSSIIMPAIGFLGNVGYILVTVVGAIMVISGRLLVGDIQSMIQYLRQFNQPINQTANIANILQSTAAAAERIFAFLDEKEEPADKANAIVPKDAKGEIEFSHVRFGYTPERVLIKDLSLKVEEGHKVAIVGPTGAGKTTLVNLLLRFYDINSGQITIDGVDIMDMKRTDLRSMIGMVLQDTWLFKGTIMENIRYGRLNATDEEVYQAAKSAHADKFIRSLPDGYQFVLNEDASNISQGQRQLLTIARAIISNPTILILDEATSSVDTRTEVRIQKAMNNLMKDRTSFIIAHRLSTIRDADTILVLNDGDIVETGTHQQLLALGGFYANLYNSQFAQNNQA